VASIVTITATSPTAQSGADGTAEYAFTVSNTSGARLRVGSRILPEAPAREEWFSVEGSERELGPRETDQITVNVRVPAGVAAGEYKLRLLVFSAERGRSGEDFTEGPVVTLEVPGASKPTHVPGAKGGFPWWAAVIAVLVLGLGGGAAWWLWPRDVQVPQLTQLPKTEAESELQQSGLTLGEVRTKVTGTVAGDIVLEQDPTAGAKVKKGSAVDLTIEAAAVEVPNVVGKLIAEAKQALASAGLAVGDVKQERTGQKPGGTVLSQEPAGGPNVSGQTAIALTVEAASVRVPRVIGQTLADATKALEGKGLSVGRVTQRRTGATPGVVLNQAPEEGQTLAPGGAVALVVEQQTVRVPKLTNLPLAQATQKLAGQGLKAGQITRQPSDRQAPETVLSQQPKAGDSVAPGTAVQLVVAAPMPRSVLTGTWRGSDGGTYYMREDGNALYWYGERSAANPAWSNVFEGKITGDTVSGTWADVPKGRSTGQGKLKLEVLNAGKVLERTGVTGGFGGKRWTRQ
jgi:beta-lactam-binding protein with PASTA domain